MSKIETFVDTLLDGRALVSDYEDWVDAWHDAPEGSALAQMELHEFLGLSFEEYKQVVIEPTYIRVIVENRRHPQLAGKSAAQRQEFALAARSQNHEDIRRLIEQLA